MKINAFNVTTTHELMAARLRNQSMEEAAKAMQPKTSQKKSESASTASAKDGVYIQDINGKLWKTEDWDGSVKPNAIAVITPQHKFLIALMQSQSCVPIHSNCIEPWEQSMKSFEKICDAEADYDGVGNTKAILALQPLHYYAAGICDNFIFPDLVTSGHFPSCGELCLAYNNKEAINAALQACGGTPMGKCTYESSTLYSQGGKLTPCRGFYEVSFKNGFASSSTYYHKGQYLRVFAQLD